MKKMLTTKQLYEAYKWEVPFDEVEPLLEKIRQNFIDFTQKHIARVNTLASFIGKHYAHHDSDKFELPYYYLLQWQASGNILAKLPCSKKDTSKCINKDTWTHIIKNTHHPEFWDDYLSHTTSFDRDNPRINVDATIMSRSALNEYVCDCMSMSIMLQKDPEAVFDWFDESIATVKGKRWIMRKLQIEHIYETAKQIIQKLKDPNRRVYFDVDGVLRDLCSYFKLSDNEWSESVNGKSIYEAITDDFSCLEKMPDTQFVPVVQKFTQSPHILTTQIEPQAQTATTKWLAKRFSNPQTQFVGKDSYDAKNLKLDDNDRIFDDHPKFPESHKLIIVGHGYNKYKSGFRINTVAELEGALDVLQPWK